MYRWLVPQLYKINGMWNKLMNEWTLSCLECSYTEATLCSPLLMDYDNSDNTVTSYRVNYWGSMPSTGRLLCFTRTYTQTTGPTQLPSRSNKWSFSGYKVVGVCETVHWHAFSTDIKNQFISTCTSYCHWAWISMGTILPLYLNTGGLGSSVGIVTAYGLDGPGNESRWGEIFRTSPDRPWGQPSLLYNGYWVFPGRKVLPGRDTDPSPPSSAEV